MTSSNRISFAALLSSRRHLAVPPPIGSLSEDPYMFGASGFGVAEEMG
jgi:hypothetical protein